MIQIVGLIALVASIVIVSVATFVWVGARKYVANGNAPVYRVRKYYAAVLVAVFVGAFVWTLPYMPYDAYADAEPAARVAVTGRMWSWHMQVPGGAPNAPLVLPANEPVEFDVTSTDVTHAFGVYDDDGRLVGQTQAMPGYTNRLRLTFERPGRYHVLCLEYCGVVHHTMITEFAVR